MNAALLDLEVLSNFLNYYGANIHLKNRKSCTKNIFPAPWVTKFLKIKIKWLHFEFSSLFLFAFCQTNKTYVAFFKIHAFIHPPKFYRYSSFFLFSLVINFASNIFSTSSILLALRTVNWKFRLTIFLYTIKAVSF